ncbi:hypothetical protein AJ79_09662 [Helicocarpus griseus UAMH5409]|uniref:Wax synthase domain-containing protein n=1 Tax=Helicocarpus griseus UAMH5409 TaxID=1447875 RepID=A0A2B7WI22_9EURO|nr:hypothetical protein AJ79_09662 [Helicocarpus griseus UAMH5409]
MLNYSSNFTCPLATSPEASSPGFRFFVDLYRENVGRKQEALEIQYRQGTSTPMLLHQFVLLYLLPVIGLLLPQRTCHSVRHVRRLIFISVAALGTWMMKRTRTVAFGNGCLLGIHPLTMIHRSATLLIFKDPEADFRRIERRVIPQKRSAGPSSSANSRRLSRTPKVQEVLVWQGYPTKLWHRFEWVSGLLLTSMGNEWNWRVKSLEPMPKAIYEQLQKHPHEHVNLVAIDLSTTSSSDRFKVNLFHLAELYILVDIIKALMMQDPYFWGNIASCPQGPQVLVKILAASPFRMRVYRSVLSIFYLKFALDAGMLLRRVLLHGLALTCPRTFQALTPIPLDASWLYPYPSGSIVSVWDHGLAGAWGLYWHQRFRFDLTSSYQWALSFLPKEMRQSRTVRGIARALISFTLSAAIHVVPALFQSEVTNPLSSIGLFFVLQGFGIILQWTWTSFVWPRFFSRNLSIPSRRVANFVFLFVWLFITGPYVFDDYARSGLWLTEYTPISLVRAFGFGGDRGGWWRWGGNPFRIWRGETWWESGIRIF